MSRLFENEADPTRDASPSLELVIEAQPRDLGGFSVRRALPSAARRLIGPFIFWDHMGPAVFAPGQGIDVRPHPHIHLATITYLFEGEIMHRDSLGSARAIQPGDVNWMVAGRGIVHSERTSPSVRARGGRLHGLQTWVALPLADEDVAPRFEHHDGAALPVVPRPGAELRVIAGSAYGANAPTGVLSPTLYVHARLAANASLAVDDEHAERAVYVVDGAIEVDGRRFDAGALMVLRRGVHVVIGAPAGASIMLLGGAPLDGKRHIWWNFVSSSEARIEQAKRDWREGRFPKVPGDEIESIPLPESKPKSESA